MPPAGRALVPGPRKEGEGPTGRYYFSRVLASCQERARIEVDVEAQSKLEENVCTDNERYGADF
jgi:hypothetical protein